MKTRNEYHTDLRNNVAMITDASGAVVERYSYDPYGAATIQDADGDIVADSTIGNVYRFASRQYDGATGLYYYRNRMYSPTMGRFLQRDPIWYEDGMNVYSYTTDNPISYNDPFGLSKKYYFVEVGRGAVLGGLAIGGNQDLAVGIAIKDKIGFAFDSDGGQWALYTTTSTSGVEKGTSGISVGGDVSFGVAFGPLSDLAGTSYTHDADLGGFTLSTSEGPSGAPSMSVGFSGGFGYATSSYESYTRIIWE